MADDKDEEVHRTHSGVFNPLFDSESGKESKDSKGEKERSALDVLANLPPKGKLVLAILFAAVFIYLWYILASLNKPKINRGNQGDMVKKVDNNSCKPYEETFVIKKDGRWEFTGCNGQYQDASLE